MLKSLESSGHEVAMNKSAMKDVRRAFIADTQIPDQQAFESVISKKAAMTSAKALTGDERKAEIVMVEGKPTFALIDNTVIPTLRLVHRFPSIYPVFRCDKGALKFIINGANVMCPGLTQPTSHMDDVKSGTMVALYVEGKTHAVALGITKMSTAEIREVNKGIAVQTFHFLNDAFWKFQAKKK